MKMGIKHWTAPNRFCLGPEVWRNGRCQSCFEEVSSFHGALAFLTRRAQGAAATKTGGLSIITDIAHPKRRALSGRAITAIIPR